MARSVSRIGRVHDELVAAQAVGDVLRRLQPVLGIVANDANVLAMLDVGG